MDEWVQGWREGQSRARERGRKGERKVWVEWVLGLTGYSVLEDLNTEHEVRLGSNCNNRNRHKRNRFSKKMKC